MKLTLVSPTYNEAENVPRLAQEVGAALSGIDYELLIVDDDSPDLTWAIGQELSSRNPRVRVLRRTTNRGLSPAVIEGFLSSLSGYVGVIDADLQHDPAILPRMIAALDAGADIAVGSRYVDGGGIGTWNAARRFQSWIATRLAQTFLGVSLADPMSGYFMMRRSDLRRIYTQLDPSGFKILLEIVARLSPSRLDEVPYVFRTRVAGKSKLTSKVVLQYLAQLWKLSSASRYLPIRFVKFGLVGALGTVVNMCVFSLLAELIRIQDWRISALATIVANICNYLLNNAWTFAERGHRGWSLLRGYVSYFGFSLIGMAASTLTFASLAYIYRTFPHLSEAAKIPFVAALVFQLGAILVGMVFNYQLNRRFTWRDVNLNSSKAFDFQTADDVGAGLREAISGEVPEGVVASWGEEEFDAHIPAVHAVPIRAHEE